MPHPKHCGCTEDYYADMGDSVNLNEKILLKETMDYFQLWKNSGRIVTNEYDIRYLAGISVCGMIYYRQRGLDDIMPITVGDAEYPVPIDMLWWKHETCEQAYAEHIGRQKGVICADLYRQTKDEQYVTGMMTRMHYRAAHQDALRIEYAVARAWFQSVSNWTATDAACVAFLDAYTKACDALITSVGSISLKESPPDLDLYPYQDPPPDMESLQMIADSGGPVSALLLDPGDWPGEDGRPASLEV